MADDLLCRIEVNVCEFLLSMGTAGGGSTRDGDEVTWTVGGSPIGYHNAVLRCHTDDHRALALIDEWLAELRGRRVPGSWHLSPTMRPPNLGVLLLERGFTFAGEEPAMALACSDLVEPEPPDGLLSVHLVRSARQLGDYRGVLAVGFGEGPKEANWVADVWRQIGYGDASPWHHYVAYLDGTAVSTASVLHPDDTAGIYFVATHPDFRRRGFGATITYTAVKEAQRHGATYAVLGSSPMGQAIYERLGFRTAFNYALYEWEP